MPINPYISCEEAAQNLNNPDWVFVDCRFVLTAPAQARGDYLKAHLPGAVFADFSSDMAQAQTPGMTGRHPLPGKDHWVASLERLGISNSTRVVAYDGQAGQSAAGRFWWMLRWAGHAAVSVLDGGFTRWSALPYAQATSTHTNARGQFTPHFDDTLQVSTAEVAALARDQGYALLDSRAIERFLGESETIDPQAGHIPGARAAPLTDNITADGMLKPVAELARRFDALTGALPAERTVFYCGSGVSATQNLLAYATVRGTLPRFYVGSWSGWIADPARVIARGP